MKDLRLSTRSFDLSRRKARRESGCAGAAKTSGRVRKDGSRLLKKSLPRRYCAKAKKLQGCQCRRHADTQSPGHGRAVAADEKIAKLFEPLGEFFAIFSEQPILGAQKLTPRGFSIALFMANQRLFYFLFSPLSKKESARRGMSGNLKILENQLLSCISTDASQFVDSQKLERLRLSTRSFDLSRRKARRESGCAGAAKTSGRVQEGK